MYIPPQWRIAFPSAALALAAFLATVTYGWLARKPVLAGISGGLFAGLTFSIAWTMRRFVPLLTIAVCAIPGVLLSVLLFKSWTEIALAVGCSAFVVGSWIVGYGVLYTGHFHRESVSPIEHLGDQGGRRALIVYHSAHRGFQRSLQRDLATVLASRGWQIDMTTASAAAPSNIEPYDLIVLGAPSFNWIPARPITSFVQRLGDLHGKNFVLVVSGGGMTERAMSCLRAQVEAAQGHVMEALEVWTTRPNPRRFGTTEPHAIMRKLGDELVNRFQHSIPPEAAGRR